MDRIACLLALSAQEVGSFYHSNRCNREGVGRSLRNCRSARRNSAKRQEIRRGCVCPARSPHCATLRYVCANEYAHFQLCRALLAFRSEPARRPQALRGHDDICRATTMPQQQHVCRKRILARCVMVKKRRQSRVVATQTSRNHDHAMKPDIAVAARLLSASQ